MKLVTLRSMTKILVRNAEITNTCLLFAVSIVKKTIASRIFNNVVMENMSLFSGN